VGVSERVPETDPAGTSVRAVVFRLPKPTYGVVFFLLIGITPIALYGGEGEGTPARVSGLTALYLIPILIAAFIARTSTRVDREGIRINAVFGSRWIPWEQMRGIAISGRNLYAVTNEGSLRLPCVRQRDLSAVALLSGGHLPELPWPKIKSAPGRRR
jgi:hypothetical protein